MKKVVLFSGPFHVGKTTLAIQLCDQFGYLKISSGEFLRSMAEKKGEKATREELQELGDRLDAETDYNWVIDKVAAPLLSKSDHKLWFFDAVRKHQQVRNFKESFDFVKHIHLISPEEIIEDRYKKNPKNYTPYKLAVSHPNEVESRSLQDIADLVLDTSLQTPRRLAEQVNEFVSEAHHA